MALLETIASAAISKTVDYLLKETGLEEIAEVVKAVTNPVEYLAGDVVQDTLKNFGIRGAINALISDTLKTDSEKIDKAKKNIKSQKTNDKIKKKLVINHLDYTKQIARAKEEIETIESRGYTVSPAIKKSLEKFESKLETSKQLSVTQLKKLHDVLNISRIRSYAVKNITYQAEMFHDSNLGQGFALKNPVTLSKIHIKYSQTMGDEDKELDIRFRRAIKDINRGIARARKYPSTMLDRRWGEVLEDFSDRLGRPIWDKGIHIYTDEETDEIDLDWGDLLKNSIIFEEANKLSASDKEDLITEIYDMLLLHTNTSKKLWEARQEQVRENAASSYLENRGWTVDQMAMLYEFIVGDSWWDWLYTHGYSSEEADAYTSDFGLQIVTLERHDYISEADMEILKSKVSSDTIDPEMAIGARHGGLWDWYFDQWKKVGYKNAKLYYNNDEEWAEAHDTERAKYRNAEARSDMKRKLLSE